MLKYNQPEKLNKYVFTFNYYDKNNLVSYIELNTTKRITEKRAVELLFDKIKSIPKTEKYCYSVQKHGKMGPYIGGLFLKKMKALKNG